MMQCCGRLLPLLVVLVAVSACDVGLPSPRPSASAHPSASAAATADPARCERLAKRGFTPCPPAPDRMPLPPTTIRNATNGAVPDATAQQWGRAFQLTEAYYRWALQANARDALTKGGLADPGASTNLFGQDLMSLDDAKRQGGRLIDQEGSMPEVYVVLLPSDLQSRISQQGLTPKPYGMAALFSGTTSRSIQFPDGHVVPLGTVATNVRLLVWGELKADADLGSIWFEYGLYGCQYPGVSNACQP
jgi:hypothetical protein